MFLDIDEFLCLRGLDDIEIFMNSLPAAWDAVYLTGFILEPAALRNARWKRAVAIHQEGARDQSVHESLDSQFKDQRLQFPNRLLA